MVRTVGVSDNRLCYDGPMLVSEDQNQDKIQLQRYEPGEITVNERLYTQSLIITSTQLIDSWQPQTLAELKAEHFQPILALKPEVLILGTGTEFSIPKASLLATVYAQGIGVESMNTGAACRTYIALAAEDRKVVAALLIK